MEADYILYKVRPEDSLKSLANRLNTTTDFLKEFHNHMTPINEHLFINNLLGVKTIYIPKIILSKKEEEEEDLLPKPDKEVSKNFFSSEYFVEETIENLETKFSINYDVQINYQEKDNQRILEFTKSNFLKDGNKPDDKASSLSIACMESLYPIPFVVASDGVIKDINDYHNSVPKKFEAKKGDIQDFMIGEISDQYVNLFSQNITDKAFFLKQIKEQFFFYFMFPSLSWFHKKSVWKEEIVFPYESKPVEMQFEANYERDYTINEMQTCIIGKSFNPKIDDGLRNDIQWNIEADYVTHKISKNLLEVRAEILGEIDDETIYKHQITVKNTQ